MAIIVGLAVGILGQGAAFDWPSPTVLIMHVGYLNAFTGTWLSPVFWTLAIEFQFYLLVGLAFSLIADRDDRVALGAMALLIAASVFASSEAFLLHWIGVFAMGMLVFR